MTNRTFPILSLSFSLPTRAQFVPFCVLMFAALTSAQTAEEKTTTLSQSQETQTRFESGHECEYEVLIRDNEIKESSGLAISRRHAHRFWTHNDSGDTARLFAIDEMGNVTGQCRLKGTKAIDWEDMASFEDGDHRRLIVADCGDNESKRKEIVLCLFDEPNPNKSSTAKQFTKLKVSYEDGPRNCESVAVDVNLRQIVLISKSELALCRVYVVPLPEREDDTAKEVHAVARHVASLVFPMATAMDIDSRSGDIWVVNYLLALRFPRTENQSIAETLGQTPIDYPLPKWKQIESLAVDLKGRVWITTEGLPAKLGRLAPRQMIRREGK
jgi:hypothetical protein